MMKVKIFSTSMSVGLSELEKEINAFLQSLYGRAVLKDIKTNMAATRIDELDTMETEYMVLISYEDMTVPLN